MSFLLFTPMRRPPQQLVSDFSSQHLVARPGTYTGLNSGKNLGIAAGIDLGFRPFFSVHPSFELRGSYPLDKGSIDSQTNILAGLKTAKVFGRFHPYAEILN